MMIRIRALYRSKKAVVYTMFFIFFAVAVVSITIIIYCFRLARPIPAPPPISQIAGCLGLDFDWQKMKAAKGASISVVTLNVLYLGLTLHKYIEHVRSFKNLHFSSMYTIYFIGCVVINAIDITFTSGRVESLFPYVDMTQFWLCAYYSYAGCHLILHLRSANASLESLTSFADCTDLQLRFKPPTKSSDQFSEKDAEETAYTAGSRSQGQISSNGIYEIRRQTDEEAEIC